MDRIAKGFLYLYSLSVLRVNIAECDSVGRVVASEEKPITEEINAEIRHIK